MIKNTAKKLLMNFFILITNTIFAGEVSKLYYTLYLDLKDDAINGPSTFYYTDKSTITAYNDKLKYCLEKEIHYNEPFITMYQEDKKRIFGIPGFIALPYCMFTNKKTGDHIELKPENGIQVIFTIEDNNIPFKQALDQLKKQFETLDNYSTNLLSIGLTPNGTGSDRLSYLLANGILAQRKKENGTVRYIHGPNGWPVTKKQIEVDKKTFKYTHGPESWVTKRKEAAAIAKLLEDKTNAISNRLKTYSTFDMQKTTIEYLLVLQRS